MTEQCLLNKLLDSFCCSNNAFVTVDFASDQRELGRNFVYMDYPVLVSGVNNFVFDPTALTNEELKVLPFEIGVPEGPVTIEVFGNCTYTADTGTVLKSFNPNYALNYSAKCKFIQQPTIISEGTRAYGFKTGISGTPNTAKAGEATNNTPKTLDITKKYLFKITTTKIMTLDKMFYSWFEIPQE